MQAFVRQPRKRGFTLIELSLVLMILSLLLSGILTITNQEVRRGKMAELKMKMTAIENALLQFRIANNRMPCPGNLTLVTTNANYGLEASTLGNCAVGGAITVTLRDGGGGRTVAGPIPVHTLKLPEDYMFDPWGGKFLYAVDRYSTQVNAFTTYDVYNTTIGSITVNGTNGQLTNRAVAILLSYGPNGHGAWQRSGARKFNGSTNADEWENCECNATAAAVANTAFDSVYVQHPPSPSSNSANVYDDFLFFYTRPQLKSSGDTLTETP